jgi:hypothetical protein
MLIPDRAGEFFSDEEIAAFLDMTGDDVRYAAADALDTIASDQALVVKAVKILDLQTDGPATAESLMKRADKLRAQADAEAAAEEEEAGDLFDYSEMVFNEFTKRERVMKQAERNE